MTISTLKKMPVASMYLDPKYKELPTESANRLFKLHEVIRNKIDALDEEGEDTLGLTFLLCAVGDGARAIITLQNIAKTLEKEEAELNAEVEEIS